MLDIIIYDSGLWFFGRFEEGSVQSGLKAILAGQSRDVTIVAVYNKVSSIMLVGPSTRRGLEMAVSLTWTLRFVARLREFDTMRVEGYGHYLEQGLWRFPWFDLRGQFWGSSSMGSLLWKATGFNLCGELLGSTYVESSFSEGSTGFHYVGQVLMV